MTKSAHQTTKHASHDVPSVESERRTSVTEECDSILTRFSSNTAPEPIPITKGRRGSAGVFGISNVAFDDYVQKDLVSSSWS